jgi:uncharacterized membrane protein YgcG
MDGVAAEEPQPARAGLVVRLPPFWPSNAAAWFANADGQFALRGITDQRVKYYNVLSALPESSVNLVIDLVEMPEPPQDAYVQLRDRLFGAHQLSDYQKIETLFAMPTLGGKKPSEMLADMTRMCPRAEVNSMFFTYCFLQRLPRELRVLLSDVDHADRRALAIRADQLWAHNSRYDHDTSVAAVASDPEPAPVAAVSTRGQQRGGSRRGGRFRGSNRGAGGQRRTGGGASDGVPAANMTPSDLARAGSDLCYYHWSFGDKASKCTAPCGWQGN